MSLRPQQRDTIEDLAVKLAAQHAKAERELIAAVLAAHPDGVRVASEAGVRRHVFTQPDLHIMWCRAAMGRGLTKGGLLREIKAALQSERLWDDREVAPNAAWTMRWSDACLLALIDELPSQQLVKLQAKRLLELERRQREAERLYHALLSTLDHPAREWATPRRAAA